MWAVVDHRARVADPPALVEHAVVEPEAHGVAQHLDVQLPEHEAQLLGRAQPGLPSVRHHARPGGHGCTRA